MTQGLSKEEIIAVPGSDNGTMKKRFTELKYNRKIVAKTGTLNDTSAFAGYIFDTKDIFFGVFNHTRPHADKKVVRSIQDKLVKKAIDLNQTTQTIRYKTPDYISIKNTIFTKLK